VYKKLLATVIGGAFATTLIATPSAVAADKATLTIQATPSAGLHPGDTVSVAGTLALAGSGLADKPVQLDLCYHGYKSPDRCTPTQVKTAADGSYKGQLVLPDYDIFLGFYVSAQYNIVDGTPEASATQEIQTNERSELNDYAVTRPAKWGESSVVTGVFSVFDAKGAKSGMQKVKVHLYTSTEQKGWTKLQESQTDDSGAFKFTWRPESHRTFIQVRIPPWCYYVTQCKQSYSVSESPVSVVDVTPPSTPTPSTSPTPSPIPTPSPTPSTTPKPPVQKVRTKVSLNAGPEPVKKGRKITVAGKAIQLAGNSWAKVTGRSVAVYFRAKGSRTWTLAGWAKLDKNGRYVIRFKAKKDGSWHAVLKGDAKRHGATSPSDYIDVR
jgi:hypothetical protein